MDFTMTFTEQEIEVMLRCLAEQPYKLVAPMIQKLQVEIKKAQIIEQEKQSRPIELDLDNETDAS